MPQVLNLPFGLPPLRRVEKRVGDPPGKERFDRGGEQGRAGVKRNLPEEDQFLLELQIVRGRLSQRGEDGRYNPVCPGRSGGTG